MAEISEDFRDRILRHELNLRRFSNETARKVLAVLVAAEKDIERQIRNRMGWIAERGFDSSRHTLSRLESNLQETRFLIAKLYQRFGKELKSSLTPLARYEAEWTRDALLASLEQGGIAVSIGVGLAEGELLRQIVESRPFQGALLRGWSRKLAADTYHRVQGAIRTGLLQGESIDKIVRRLRGTRAGKFRDGILAASRREAEAVARTAVQHVAQTARNLTLDANRDLLKGYQWLATLDARTCPICQPRDRKLYTLDRRPVGHAILWGPGPGLIHWNCRCTSTAVFKSWRELGIDLDDVTPQVRASASGAVPGDTDYETWIAAQDYQTQVQALGKRRADLMRSGKVKFDDFYDDRGELLTLDELKRADRRVE